MSKYEKILNLVNNLLMCDSYELFKNNMITDIENTIIYYLNELYDIKNIDTYLNSKQQIEKILKETKNFKISENQETYDYIKNKFQQHSVYKNSNIDIEITDGKLKIINSNVDYSKMSKSEQNFFKFLYFDILVHQKKQSGNLHVIVDDPFDSYDDIYVQDSIGSIVNLVNEWIHDIETIDIVSHSMYIVYLYENVSSQFKIYWLDQVKLKNEIFVYSDKYELLLDTLYLTSPLPISMSSSSHDIEGYHNTNLYLNINKKSEVSGVSWNGIEWKSITFVE